VIVGLDLFVRKLVASLPYYPTRKLTIFALDPSVKVGGKILRTQIEIPNEVLDRGPRGYRVHVVDYDSTRDALYRSGSMRVPMNCDDRLPEDPWENMQDSKLLGSLDFHAWMTYGIIMKTLARFEFALGRRIRWSFPGHQILVSPHAFSDANAFYSDQAQGLFFGYFPNLSGRKTIFTCLSYEVVAHETTHALLDGLRERYMDPSSPQQAGFHEAFADIVALLSVFSSESIVGRLVDLGMPKVSTINIRRMDLTPEKLRSSALLGLANEMGSELSGIHGHALRRSVSLPPNRAYLDSSVYQEPHMCGEVLVAAVLNAFLDVWIERLKAIGDDAKLDRSRAAEEGAAIAERLLTMSIRAIDYCPPTDLQFCDFASGILTADWELNPRDDKYNIRSSLLTWLRAYGIDPRSKGGQPGREPGTWDPPPPAATFKYDRTHLESMKTDHDELFRFLWVNRQDFRLYDQALTRVLSVRPCVRIGWDGFVLRETVVEYHQQLKIFARELAKLKIRKPDDMPDSTEMTLFGGNAVIFDEYGHVKYSIGNGIISSDKNQERQTRRLRYIWDHGGFSPGASKMRAFAHTHRMRRTGWYRSVDIEQDQET
jgi:hypothetical protein